MSHSRVFAAAPRARGHARPSLRLNARVPGSSVLITAQMAYSTYVGFVQLSRIGQPRMSHEEFEAYIRDFIETLVPR